jgi:hypothetical protein
MKLLIVGTLLCILIQIQAQTFKECISSEEFENVHVYDGINLTLEMGNEYAWCADTATELENLDININEGTLVIRKIPGNKYKVEPNLKVIYKDLRGISGYGKANILTLNLIKTDSIFVSLKSGAIFYGSFDIDYLNASVTEGCLLTADGYANYQDIKSNLKATYSGFDLEGVNGIVKTTSGGIAKVNITDSLSVKATTGGYVGYKGNPAIDEEKILGGKIVNDID